MNLDKQLYWLPFFSLKFKSSPLLQGFCLCFLPGPMHGRLLVIFPISNHILPQRRGCFRPCSLGSRFWHAGVYAESWFGKALGNNACEGVREGGLDKEELSCSAVTQMPHPVSWKALEPGRSFRFVLFEAGGLGLCTPFNQALDVGCAWKGWVMWARQLSSAEDNS